MAVITSPAKPGDRICVRAGGQVIVRTQLSLSLSTIAVCTRIAYVEDSAKIAFISSFFRVKRGQALQKLGGRLLASPPSQNFQGIQVQAEY